MTVRLQVEATGAESQYKFGFYLDDGAKAATFGEFGDENAIPDAAADDIEFAIKKHGARAFVEQDDREVYTGAVRFDLPTSLAQAQEALTQAWNDTCAQHIGAPQASWGAEVQAAYAIQTANDALDLSSISDRRIGIRLGTSASAGIAGRG